MSRNGLSSAQLTFGITAIASMVLSILVTQTAWGKALMANLGTYLLVGLPGLHGVLIAESALKHYRKTQSSKVSLIVELICAGLLILAVLVALINIRSLLAFYCGLILAAIATFPLTVVGTIEAIKAVRKKQYRRRNVVRLLLNSIALLIYCSLVFSLTFLVAMGLAGESYMGN
ncbi:MAG TPA: hypothetical protein V6D29_07410 [Leptolyngbyaceae cyanobacterium]